MRDGFAHHAVVRLEPGGDYRAPGAAITVELCGSWDHPPPCPLAPHFVGAEPDGDDVRLRILFSTEPEHEAEVRERITAALAGGSITGPEEIPTAWRLVSSEPTEVRASEHDHLARLATS